MCRIGIDLGGTKIEGIVLDDDLIEYHRIRVDTISGSGYCAVLDQIVDLYRALARATNGSGHSLGIGMPGSVSKRTGRLRFCNIVAMNGKYVEEDLRARLKRDFILENDANCFTFAEARLGAAKGRASVLGVVLGTGCGGGIVLQETMVPGHNHIAGEWGHMVFDPAGPDCYCGKRGCVERYLSGGSLQARYREITGQSVSVETIVQLANANDETALMLLNRFYRDFGAAVGNLITVLDPDIVVVGGGLSHLERIYSDGVRAMRGHLFADEIETPVVRNKLGPSAGVFGAALLGR